MSIRICSAVLALLLGAALTARAGDAAPREPSVQDNIAAMDVNHDGMVTASEIRAFVEARNGKGYQSQLLDEMEVRADSRSCASPFSGTFY